MLYLESMLRAAEIKYLTALGLIRAYLTLRVETKISITNSCINTTSSGSLDADTDTDFVSPELIGLICAALVNAAASRASRQLKGQGASHPSLPRVCAETEAADAEESDASKYDNTPCDNFKVGKVEEVHFNMGSSSRGFSVIGVMDVLAVFPGRDRLCVMSAVELVDIAMTLYCGYTSTTLASHSQLQPHTGETGEEDSGSVRKIVPNYCNAYSSAIIIVKKALILEKVKRCYAANYPII